MVQEFGYGDDVDEDLRAGIEDVIGGELVDEDYDDVTDGVLLWWREDDGDLTDALVDVRASLDDGGLIWLLTRKPGRDRGLDAAGANPGWFTRARNRWEAASKLVAA